MVKYKPKTVGKKPVIATPSPNKASANTAKICSFITRRTKTMVKAKNPGISLKLCRIPISIPVNAAFSTTKLFNNAAHALKAIGIAIDIRINKETGLIKFFFEEVFKFLNTYDPLSLNIAIRLIVIMQLSSFSSNKLTFTSTNS